jgi:uncharacterized surface protein with fasciclin (FAS1) repeats
MRKQLTKSFSLIIIALAAGTFLFSACSDNNGSKPKKNLNIAATVQNNSSLSTLSDLVSVQGLADTLSQTGPITLFAPTNSAILKAGLADSSDSTIKQVLEYHIVNQNLTYQDLLQRDSASIVALNGDTLYFKTKGDSVTINNGQAVITSKGTKAANGTIFVIDSLLTPPSK